MPTQNEDISKMTNDEKEQWKKRVVHTEREVHSIKSTIEQHSDILENHSSKLDAIIEAVTKAEAIPKTDHLKVVAAACAMIAALGVILGGLGYFITLISSKDARVNEVLLMKNYEISQIRDKYANEQIMMLQKRVYDLETRQSRLRFYNQPRSNNTVYLSRSWNRW